MTLSKGICWFYLLYKYSLFPFLSTLLKKYEKSHNKSSSWLFTKSFALYLFYLFTAKSSNSYILHFLRRFNYSYMANSSINWLFWKSELKRRVNNVVATPLPYEYMHILLSLMLSELFCDIKDMSDNIKDPV